MTQAFHPLVSIIIPVYNGANYIRQAIDSALSQTYKNIEVIVVNDGSDDQGKTKTIALEYGSEIRYFSKPNGGVGSALNLAIENMKGEYFSWLSHDDVYHKNKIECQIKTLQSINNFDAIIYNNFECVDDCLNHLSFADPHKFHSVDKLNTSLYPLLKSLIHGCALLVPIKYFKEIGIFDEDLPGTQDYALWFKFLRIAPIHYDSTVILKSRVHLEQGSKTMPLYIRECNNLWLSFVNQVTEQEMISIDGSQYLFLINTINHLNYGPYEETIKFIKNKIRILISKIKVTIILLPSDNLTDIFGSIESVMKQTHDNFELLVTIHTPSAVNHDYFQDNRIKIINQKNIDPIQQQDLLITKISGNYIVLLQAGDLFHHKKLFIQLNHVLTEGLSVSYGAYSQIDEVKKNIRNIYISNFNNQYLPLCLYIKLIAVSTIMIKSDSLKNLYNKRKSKKLTIVGLVSHNLPAMKCGVHTEILTKVRLTVIASIRIFLLRAMSKITRTLVQKFFNK